MWVALALGVTVLVLFALPSYRQGEASIISEVHGEAVGKIVYRGVGP